MMFMDTPNYRGHRPGRGAQPAVPFLQQGLPAPVAGQHPVGLALLAKLSTRLRQRIDEIETFPEERHPPRGALPADPRRPQRRENCRVEIPVAKQLVAGHLSIQPETFSRIMHRLGDEGIIRLDGREISILDRERLECFSEQPHRLIAVKRATAPVHRQAGRVEPARTPMRQYATPLPP